MKISRISKLIPDNYDLKNYPNPFNPSTKIQYAISSLPDGKAGRQFVSLKVYDILGNEIASLVNEEKPAGDMKLNLIHQTSTIIHLPEFTSVAYKQKIILKQ